MREEFSFECFDDDEKICDEEGWFRGQFLFFQGHNDDSDYFFSGKIWGRFFNNSAEVRVTLFFIDASGGNVRNEKWRRCGVGNEIRLLILFLFFYFHCNFYGKYFRDGVFWYRDFV